MLFMPFFVYSYSPCNMALLIFLKTRPLKTKKMGKSFCQVKRNVYICTQIQKNLLTTNTDNDK